MQTPISEEEWRKLEIGDKIIDEFKHCWIVTERDANNPNKIRVHFKGYTPDGWLEWRDKEVLCDGSPISELNHPDVTIVIKPIPPQSRPGP